MVPKTTVKPTQKAKAAAAPKKAAAKPAPKATAGKSKGKAVAPASDNDESDDDFNSSESEGENDPQSSQAAMLAALEAHSRALLGLAGGDDEDDDVDAAEDAESEGGNAIVIGESDDDEGFHTDDGWGAEDGFVSDSEDEMGAIDAAFMSAKKGKGKKAEKNTKDKAAKPAPAPAAPTTRVPEVVFAPSTGSASSALMSKSEKRAFMKGNSAKMMGIPKEDDAGGRGKKRGRATLEEEEAEASNLRLDKTLHDMLLTNLLPGDEAEKASRPVEKRNALSGRLLELASYSLPGEGSSRIRAQGLSSHPAHVRTGLMHAQQRRAENARAESEAAGSWVKGIGGLGDMGKRGAGVRPSGGNAARGVRTFGLEIGKKKGMSGKKAERARGLGMGVGSYKNGTLTVSEREIDRVNNLGKGGVRKKGGKGKRK